MKVVIEVSLSDPKSKEDLRELARKERDGEHLSDNDKWELKQARKAGVKGVFDK